MCMREERLNVTMKNETMNDVTLTIDGQNVTADAGDDFKAAQSLNESIPTISITSIARPTPCAVCAWWKWKARACCRPRVWRK